MDHADRSSSVPAVSSDRTAEHAPRGVVWTGTAVAAVLAPLLAVAAHASRRWAQGTLPADRWNGVGAWLPTIFPARVDYAVAPWPALLTTTTLLTLVLCVAALVGVLRPMFGRRWWLDVAMLWAVLVASAVVAVGAAQLGEVLRTIDLFGGRGGSFVRMFTIPALGEALRWGLLWGLPAAAVGVWAGRRVATSRGAQGRRHRRGLVAAVLVATAVASGVWSVATARSAAISTETEVRPPPVAPEPAVTDPPALRAPTAATDLAGGCDPGDLEASFVYTDAATGRRFGVATVTNVGSETCLVAGLPDLAFQSEDGNAVRPEIAEWEGLDGESVEADVSLAPGASAVSDLTWRGSGAGATTVSHVLVAPRAGAERTVVAEPIDLETGALLEVTAWRPADAYID